MAAGQRGGSTPSRHSGPSAADPVPFPVSRPAASLRRPATGVRRLSVFCRPGHPRHTTGWCDSDGSAAAGTAAGTDRHGGRRCTGCKLQQLADQADGPTDSEDRDRRSELSAQSPVFISRSSVFGAYPSEFDPLCSVFVPRSSALNPRFLFLGARPTILSPRPSVLGPRFPVFAPPSSVLVHRPSSLGPRCSVLCLSVLRRRSRAVFRGTCHLSRSSHGDAIPRPVTGVLSSSSVLQSAGRAGTGSC